MDEGGMRAGAAVSGAAHLGLILLAIFSGALFGAEPARPLQIAEVTLMTGAEFEAAQSAAPVFDADAPPAPEAPKPAPERADVALAETDAAPSAPRTPDAPAEPVRGETATPPPDAPDAAAVADPGARLAGPPAPEDERLAAASEPPPEPAPVVERAPPPAPAPRAAAPRVERTTPEPPAPAVAPLPAEAETAPPEPEAETAPEPEPEIAEIPTPAEETPPEPEEEISAAPRVAPPPPSKPRQAVEAAAAERPARETRPPEETGATRQAAEAEGGGTTQTVGRLSFRDKESLRVGIQNYFSPPPGLPDERTLRVTLEIEVSREGRIVSGPERIDPRGGLNGQQAALERAGKAALGKANAAGVFAQLPKDRYETWRVMRVTFLPRDLELIN